MDSIDKNNKSKRKNTGLRRVSTPTSKIIRNAIIGSATIMLTVAMLTLSSEATNIASGLQQSSNTSDNDTSRTSTSTNTTLPTTAIPISNEPNHVAMIGQEAPFYSPGNIIVKVGTTVTFKNHDAIAHTATGTNDGADVSSPAPNNIFDTGLLKIGEEKQVTFDKAGTVNYFCSIHPFMRGAVTVTPT